MDKQPKPPAYLGSSGSQTKRSLFMVFTAAFCLGAAFLVVALLFASCSTQASSVIKADGSARISVSAEIPEALAARLRKLASAGGSSTPPAFLDEGAIRSAIAKRPGLSILSLEKKGPYSLKLELSARSLEELAASPDIKKAGLLSISKGQGWTECRFRLTRGPNGALSTLMPGLDPDLLDAISPPALEEDPVTVAEYKTMLRSVLGDKAMPAMEEAALKLSIAAPGAVLDSGGGSLSGSTLSARLPIIELLVLEKPVELWIRWKS